MAKKRPIIDLTNEKISYEENGKTFILQRLKTTAMTVDVKCYKKSEFLKEETLPFAHLPKKIKARINPLK